MSTHQSAAVRRTPRVRASYLTAVAIVLLLALLAAAYRFVEWSPPPPAVRRAATGWEPVHGRFAGSESCRECHQEIYDRQAESAHALTLRSLKATEPRSPVGNGQGVVDPDTGARYEMVRDGSRCAISVQRAGAEARQPLDFEFGSGRRAFAYLGKTGDHEYLDARLNYYRKIGRWDFTSGQEKPLPTLLEQPLGRPLGPADTALCFSCHTTVLRATGVEQAGTPSSQVRLDLARSELGIRCERCHGPRQEHVRLFRAGAVPARPEKRSAVQINELCGECHTAPDVGPGHEGMARFQPLGLARSECFKQSAGRLSCLSCHDPHSNAREDEAYYVSRCLSCHTPTAPASKPRGSTGKPCPVNPKEACVSCHMPRDSSSMLHITFTDHWIRVPTRGSHNDLERAYTTRTLR
ncbi:MAG: multiheme c-type cytochrome [Armatimonadota bacterium]